MSGLEIILPLVGAGLTAVTGFASATAQKQGAELSAAAEEQKRQFALKAARDAEAQRSLNEDEYDRRLALEKASYKAAVGPENASDAVLGAIMSDAAKAKENRAFNTQQEVNAGLSAANAAQARAAGLRFEGQQAYTGTLLGTGVKVASGLGDAAAAYRTSSLYPTKTNTKTNPYN